MKDITIGQYYPTNSIIHNLDPRVKLFGTMILIISLFITNSFLSYLLVGLALCLTIRLSKIPLKTLLQGLKAIFILLLISVSFNLFLTDGKVLVQFFIFKITDEGIRRALFIAIRLAFLVIGTSIMTLTTTPNDLSDALEKSFHFLTRFRVPVHEIAMMMSIALRFIPILMEETDKIMKAQKSRGADFESKGLMNKAKALIPLLVPLFVSAIRRAVDLANAMEARCYRGGNGRTKMKPLHYKKADKYTYGIYVVYLIAVIAIDWGLSAIPALQIFHI